MGKSVGVIGGVVFLIISIFIYGWACTQFPGMGIGEMIRDPGYYMTEAPIFSICMILSLGAGILGMVSIAQGYKK